MLFISCFKFCSFNLGIKFHSYLNQWRCGSNIIPREIYHELKMTWLSLYLPMFASRLAGWKSLGKTKDFIIFILQILLVLVCFSWSLDLVDWMCSYTCKSVLCHWVATKSYTVFVCLDFYFYLWVCIHDWIFAWLQCASTHGGHRTGFFSDAGLTYEFKLTILDAGNPIWVLCKIHKSS